MTDMRDDHEATRRALSKKRAELVSLDAASAEDRETVALDQQSVGRLSRMDAMQRQAMAKAQARRREQEIARIDAALARLDAGEYGDCLECGEAIAPKRLRLDPAAALCIACAAK